MRLPSVYSILLVAGAVHAQAIIESDIDYENASGPAVLIVHPVQTTLYEQGFSSPREGNTMAGLSSLWKDSPAWLLPGLVEIGVQISNFRDRNISANAAADQLATRFDYFGETDDALKVLGSDEHWLLPPIYDIAFGSSLNGGWTAESDAKRIFRDGPSEKAVFVHFIYFMSPDLLQVRVVADMKVIRRHASASATMQTMTRRFEFMSRPLNAECSQWEHGQRDKVLAEIERKYGDRLSAFPQNKKAYRQDYKLALRSIKDPVIMPPMMVFANCWPDDSLSTALRTGIVDVVAMIRADFNTSVRITPREEMKMSFEGFTLKGRRKTFRGTLIGESGLQSIVRLKNGDVYSVPTDPDSL